MLLVNNLMPPKKMQYEKIIYVSTYNQCDMRYNYLTQINKCDWLLFVYHGIMFVYFRFV